MPLLVPPVVPEGSTLLGMHSALTNSDLKKRFNLALAITAGSVLAQQKASISNSNVPPFDTLIVRLATRLGNIDDSRNSQALVSIVGALIKGLILAPDNFDQSTVTDEEIMDIIKTQVADETLLIQLLS